ncbi:unnamed protein product [Phytophthora lilii]|uniref:Unnamed protein product n=1 Tax=Phytophthora lilii TaxID=2077276 RepID=A0A9W6XB31_9STRA|nr:unnamed protein product [Phytophthora lilii]
MKHAPPAALDADDFDDAVQQVVDECRRGGHSGAKRASRVVACAAAESLRFADFKSQDPAAFAHLLADHFVAREASNVAAPPPAKPSRPVAGAVSLGSFRSWQFGERCLATYRVLFGHPLWAATTPTAVPACSPRPRKRKHVTPPTGSSDSSHCRNGVDQLNELVELGAGELVSLPTVDELLELPMDAPLVLDARTDATQTGLEADDVLAGLALGLDEGLDPEPDAGDDNIDLLWDLDAVEVECAMLTEGEEEELRFLATSPDAFSPVSPDEDMEDN